MQKLSQRPSNNFSSIFNLYGCMLFKISMVYLGNKEDAEEIIQEVFYKLLYKSPEFNDDEHEKAWLIRTTINLCKDTLRSVWHKRVIKMEFTDEYYKDPSDIDILMEILALPEKYKMVIHLHYYEDYTIKQISELLGIKESAVKMRLQRGRQLLKIKLEGESE